MIVYTDQQMHSSYATLLSSLSSILQCRSKGKISGGGGGGGGARERWRREPLRGSGGMPPPPPPENFEI